MHSSDPLEPLRGRVRHRSSQADLKIEDLLQPLDLALGFIIERVPPPASRSSVVLDGDRPSGASRRDGHRVGDPAVGTVVPIALIFGLSQTDETYMKWIMTAACAAAISLAAKLV
jgi:hypothetical protein